MMVAMKPDPVTGKSDPEKMKAFKASHPDSVAQVDFLANNNPPVSFANSAYFGIHTFKLVNRAKKTTLVRWRFVPQDGELKSMPPNFLEQALIERTKQGPLRWDMIIAIGEAGDSVDDPTLTWPANRKEIKVGRLTLSSTMPQKGAQCEKINFDPLVISDGIEPTNDPILLFHSPAYAASFAKRMDGM